MTLSTLRSWAARTLGSRQLWPLKVFSNPCFERISANQLVEEENYPDYVAAWYYPVRIGEVFASRYQVVGKVGFGTTSTVWLARDLTGCRYVTLKICIRSSNLGSTLSQELAAYQRLERGPILHPGRHAVRRLLDSFVITGPDGEHQCLVHQPLWESVKSFLARNPVGRLYIPILVGVLLQVFRALDYMHKCRIIHTDIKAANIMLGIEDTTVFENFEQAELDQPTPRKEIDGRIIYLSRRLGVPKPIGAPILCDLGSAVWGEEQNVEFVQPDVYRSPEVILQSPWSYPIDVWNVGCMIWDIFEGGHLFYGTDPEHNAYRSRAHLAEIIALLGPPPPGFVSQCKLRSKFFSEAGEFQAGIPVPPAVSLEQLETNLDGEDKELFLQFMRKMLQWDPQNRMTPKELLEDAWMKKHSR